MACSDKAVRNVGGPFFRSVGQCGSGCRQRMKIFNFVDAVMFVVLVVRLEVERCEKNAIK